jgi:hypothetical protein
VEGIGLIVDGEVRTDTIRARDENGTTSVSKLAVTGSLTVGGASVVGGNPIFCGGRVNGSTATGTSSIGQVGYSIQRPSTHSTTGVIWIVFDSPAPSNTYVVHLTSMLFGTVRLWESYAPTVNGFQVVMTSTTWQLVNGLFHFSVVL